MSWAVFEENWSHTERLIADAFPHAKPVKRPVCLTDLAELLRDLADTHDLTLAEAAELVDEVAYTAQAQARYVSDVTHKMVASS